MEAIGRRNWAAPLLAALVVLAAADAAAAASLFSDAELRGSLAPTLAATVVHKATQLGPLISAYPPVEVRSLLRMVHLVGLCLGLGSALSLDLSALAWVRRDAVPADAAGILRHGERLVAIGFALLWASGIALTWLAWRADPAFMGNPKILVKIAVVLALTANAAVLHLKVLPVFAASLGRPLAGGWRRGERALFVVCGAVSAASWAYASALGVLREWNYVVQPGLLLGLWAAGVAFAILAIDLSLPGRNRPAADRAYRGRDRRGARVAEEAPVPLHRPRPRIAA